MCEYFHPIPHPSLDENTVLQHLDASWCGIRLAGAKAMAKAIGTNVRLSSLNLAFNSVANDTVGMLTRSLRRNCTLHELDLRGNQLIGQYNAAIEKSPATLVTGKQSELFQLIVAGATNRALRILRVRANCSRGDSIDVFVLARTEFDRRTLHHDPVGSLGESRTDHVGRVGSLGRARIG